MAVTHWTRSALMIFYGGVEPFRFWFTIATSEILCKYCTIILY